MTALIALMSIRINYIISFNQFIFHHVAITKQKESFKFIERIPRYIYIIFIYFFMYIHKFILIIIANLNYRISIQLENYLVILNILLST